MKILWLNAERTEARLYKRRKFANVWECHSPYDQTWTYHRTGEAVGGWVSFRLTLARFLCNLRDAVERARAKGSPWQPLAELPEAKLLKG